MDRSIPTRAALKVQAKRLRSTLGDQGKTITHSQSLEILAQQFGLRDWNTLHAAAPDEQPENALTWQVGQPVSGRYLGHPFAGQIKSATATNTGFWQLTLRFSKAIDTVESKDFSNLRQQVKCTIGPDGCSPQKTSNGQAQISITH
jgi:hypothetical protein